MNEHTCNECGVMFCKLKQTYPPKFCSAKCRRRNKRQRLKPWLTESGKRQRLESVRRYRKTEKGKAKTKDYRNQPEVKAKQALITDDRDRWEGMSLACMSKEDKAKTIAVYMERDQLNKDLGHVGYHVDHILPRNMGGDHIWYNLQILTASENLSKGDRFRAEDKTLYQQRIASLFI